MRFSDFQQWWRAAWSTYFWQSVITKPGEGANTSDIVLMAGETGNETQQLTRLEQFGDVCCPPSSSGCISWQKGAGGSTISLGDPGTRPTDGKPGDRGLYSNKAGTRVHLYGAASSEPGAILATNATGARVKLEKDGTVLVDAAPGKNIVLNGGTHDNAREGDGVWAGDLILKVTSSGMTDTLKVTFQTKDPRDPFYPFPPQDAAEFSLPSGSFTFPTAGGPEVRIHLTGVITYGVDRVKS
jgi:phage gp45-like